MQADIVAVRHEVDEEMKTMSVHGMNLIISQETIAMYLVLASCPS
jgi:hypothetical protein